MLLFVSLALVAYALFLVRRLPSPWGVLVGGATAGTLVCEALFLDACDRGLGAVVCVAAIVLLPLDAIIFFYLVVTALADLPNPEASPPQTSPSSSWPRFVCALALIGVHVSGIGLSRHICFQLRRDRFEALVSEEPERPRAVQCNLGLWRNQDIVYDPTHGEYDGLWGEDMYDRFEEAQPLGGS